MPFTLFICLLGKNYWVLEMQLVVECLPSLLETLYSISVKTNTKNKEEKKQSLAPLDLGITELLAVGGW